MTVRKRVLALSLCMSIMIFLGSCSNWSKTAKGGVYGAAGGAAAGAAIGKAAGNTAAGAILGAAIGGVAGSAIGAYMDKQAEELEEDLDGATVERVGEGIKITFDSGILFDVDKSTLTPEAKENIRELAETLKKYEDTNILVEGHTDATGSDDYNMSLSQRRAESVVNYATSLGVTPGRFQIKGYGETQPVASNESAAGRQQNRRVEVAIFANEELKEAARDGELDD
ncbi:OmpA family protein [Roseivirga sp. BDSF3-8]|uniref:OmpA family protein n=1 Tax=Roseivirga sp. BDSF3-8 TaxID=3241598 RepID=UPI003532031D